MSDATCRLRDSGSWNGSAHWEGEGGQLMRFTVNNANILGTTITIASANTNQSESRIIPPAGSAEIEFSAFGAEPMYWPFDISTDSDAFIVTWELCSSWVPGDPPNG